MRSGSSPGPRTRRRCSSPSRLTRPPTCSLTTWSSRCGTSQASGPVLTSGIVTQVRARQEGASFGSDVFLISDGVLPARTQEIAEVSTTRVEPEIYVPPRPGEVVRRATGTERAQALYFDQMTNRVPVGRGRDGAPIYVNMEFLDGTRGAHVSISGISGVATKTSFALFLLHSIFRSGALRERAVNAKALVFSVKGEDLLFLDQPNVRLDDDLRTQLRRARPARRAVRVRRLLGAADPRRHDRAAERHRPHQRRRGLLVDDQRVLRAAAAALRVRRRRRRPAAVHDGHPPGRRPAPAVRRALRQQRRGEDRRRGRVHLREPGQPDRRPAHRRGRPQGLGRAGHRDGDGQRVRPPAPLVAAAAVQHHPRRPDRDAAPQHLDARPAAHRRRPAQPARARPAVRGRRGARRRDRAQGGRRSQAGCCSR